MAVTRLMELYKTIVDYMYLVPLQLFFFRRNNPSLQIVMYGASKSRKFPRSREIEIGPGWITARRQALILTNKALVCDNWVIPLSEIKEVVLTRLGATTGYVLKISTQADDHYQFGLQYHPDWETQRVMPVRVEQQAHIPMSLIRILIRVILVAYLAYYVLHALQIL
jgi:hypothetical protein